MPPNLSPFSPAVSPFVPTVASRLTALVGTLGSVPGIGGMVWEDTLAGGYETSGPGESSSGFGDALGYADAGRLAFLRLSHADPVDVRDNSYTDERAHVHVPGFDDDSALERRLFVGWQKARADAGQVLAHRLADALPASFTGAAPRLPLLLPPTNWLFASSYGCWDDLRRPAPTVRFIPQTGPDGQILMGGTNTERMSSALTYKTIQTFLPPAPSAEAWKSAAARALEQARKHGDRNVVLDMTGQPALLQGAAKPDN